MRYKKILRGGLLVLLLFSPLSIPAIAGDGNGNGNGNDISIKSNAELAQDRLTELKHENWHRYGKYKTDHEKAQYNHKLVDINNEIDVYSDLDSSTIVATVEKDNRIRLKDIDSEHKLRSVRIAYSDVANAPGFEDGKILITHYDDFGFADVKWVQEVINQDGYVYFDDLPFSEIVIGGFIGICRFTSNNVSGDKTISVCSTAVSKGFNVSLTNWHEIRDTNTSLVYSIIPNDFGITVSNYTEIPLAVSQGEIIYNESGYQLEIIENVSTETGNVSLFNVSGYNNSEIFIRTDYLDSCLYNGDCVVYDGPEAITDEAHVFVNNATFTNGLITIEISDSKIYLYSEDYAKNESTYIDSAGPAFTITSISQDKIVFVLDGNTCYLSRGLPYLQMAISAGQPYLHSPNRFVHFSDGSLYDGAFESAGTVTPATDVQYGAAIDPVNDVIFLVAVATETVSSTATGGSDFSDLKCSVGETWQAIGVLPISPVYGDSESLGYTYSYYITDVNSSTGYALRNEGYNAHVYLDFDNVPEANEYTAFVRMRKYPDTAGVFRFDVKDLENNSTTFASSEYFSLALEYSIYSCTFTTDGAQRPRIYVGRPGAYQTVIDYIHVVPTCKLQQAAESSMVKIETTKNSFEYAPQQFDITAGTQTNVTNVSYSSIESIQVPYDDSLESISIETDSLNYSYNITGTFTENTTIINEELTDEYYRLYITHLPGDDYESGFVNYTSDSNDILNSPFVATSFSSNNDNATYTLDTYDWSITTGTITAGTTYNYILTAYLEGTVIDDTDRNGIGYTGLGAYEAEGNETTIVGSRYTAYSAKDSEWGSNGSDIYVPASAIIGVVTLIILFGYIIKGLTGIGRKK